MERKVLLISGRPPMHSAGYVQDTINSLELADCKVDFLTLYDFKGQKEDQYNVLKKPLKLKLIELLIKNPWIRIFRSLYHRPYQLLHKFFSREVSLMHGDFLLVFENEEVPPIEPSLILEKIQYDYDYYVILIPQDMITSKTILRLYEKYNKPVIILCPDMYYFTGNCFFPNNCNHYLEECKDCPAYKEIGLVDIAHKNFIYKKGVFEKIKCAFICNTNDANYIRKSKIISLNKLFISSFILDIDVFKPYEKELSKKSFSIPDTKTCIIMVRYISPQNVDWNRKGGDYLIEILNLFYIKISKEERDRCLILFVGTNNVDPALEIKFDTYCTGSLNRQDLILAYNASTVFFSPSINDSGPSMVNQSMACSTPVVAFNQGTAIDVIENGINGFKADLFDSKTLSEALLHILRMDNAKYQALKNNARKKAVQCNSLEIGARNFRNIFESFESEVL